MSENYNLNNAKSLNITSSLFKLSPNFRKLLKNKKRDVSDYTILAYIDLLNDKIHYRFRQIKTDPFFEDYELHKVIYGEYQSYMFNDKTHQESKLFNLFAKSIIN